MFNKIKPDPDEYADWEPRHSFFWHAWSGIESHDWYRFLGLHKYKFDFYLGYKLKKLKLNLKKFFNSEIFAFIVIVFGLGLLSFLISLIKMDNWFISFLKTITIGFLPGNMINELYIDGVILLIFCVIAVVFGIIGGIWKVFKLIKHPIRLLFALGIILLIDFIKSALLEERFPFLYDPSLLRESINKSFAKFNLNWLIKSEKFSSFLSFLNGKISSLLSSFIPFFIKHGILIIILSLLFIFIIIKICKLIKEEIRRDIRFRKITKVPKGRYFELDDESIDVDLSMPYKDLLKQAERKKKEL